MVSFSTRTHHLNRDILVIDLNEPLDAEGTESLLAFIDGAIHSGFRKVIIDCEHLAYVSSVAVSAFIRAKLRLGRDAGVIALAAANGFVAEVLAKLRFDKFFDSYRTLDEACAAL